MEPIAKLLIGGAATTLLAWGSHALTGADYVHSLDHDAERALAEAGIEGVESGMRTDGGLSRTVVLSGEVPPETRGQAEAALAKVSGIGPILWASDIAGDYLTQLPAGSDNGDAAGTGATDPAVATCQSNIDKALDGKTINFRSGSAYMNDNSLNIVQQAADALKGCEGLKIEIGGHTDDAGPEGVNRRMSQERADRVSAALTERGIAADRITATGYGESKPLKEGDGANPANRRIEFTVSPAANEAAAEAAAEGAE